MGLGLRKNSGSARGVAEQGSPQRGEGSGHSAFQGRGKRSHSQVWTKGERLDLACEREKSACEEKGRAIASRQSEKDRWRKVFRSKYWGTDAETRNLI